MPEPIGENARLGNFWRYRTLAFGSVLSSLIRYFNIDYMPLDDLYYHILRTKHLSSSISAIDFHHATAQLPS